MSEIPTTETSTSPTETTSPPSAEQQIAATTEVKVEEKAAEGGKSLITEVEAEAFDPEKLTLPEGFDKGEHFAQFTEWAKEAGINQPQAAKLIDLYTAAAKASVEANTQEWEKQNTDWQAEVKADKELGGTNLTTVKQTISKVLDNPDMSDPKFREALDFTGAGNNPAVIRTLYRWAQKLSEGASIAGAPPARDGAGAITGQPRSIAEAMYGPNGPHSGGPRLG